MTMQPERPAEVRRRWFIVGSAASLAGGLASPVLAQGDPLPSWNDGQAKRSILDFIARVTTAGGRDLVPVPERIACFDNDGTLWSEQPLYFQFMFALDRVKALAPRHPEWQSEEPFRSVLANDMKGALASGEAGLVKIVTATHSGMTTDEFDKAATDWLATARHPRFQRPYTDLIFQPMLELLAHLGANGFKTFIVSGGDMEFVRTFSERVYGVPRDQVVGSANKTKLEMRDGKPVIVRLPEMDFIDDGPGKPVGIQKFIGRRPIFAFGNSDGDQQMLQYTAAGPGTRFMGLVHHTDAEREYSYDRQSSVGKLDKALDEARHRGWTVVDMKADWNTIYPFQKK